MKYIITLTGCSTAGKTTFSKILHSSLTQFHTFILPQTTCREVRKDDDPNWIRHLSNNEFIKENFFIVVENYGILKKDFDEFLVSSSQVAITICGPEELKYFISYENNNKQIKVIKILLRTSNDIKHDEKILEEQLSKFFPKEKAEDRLKNSKELNDKYFYNPEFLRNIDMILTREKTINEWIEEVMKALNADLVPSNIVSIHSISNFDQYLNHRQPSNSY